MAVAVPAIGAQPAMHIPKPPRSIESAQTSPSNQSSVASKGNSLTISSLRDSYVYVVVQVTRDLHPVIFSDWLLPIAEFDLGVADVTLNQFEKLATRCKRDMGSINRSLDWHLDLAGSMISLAQLMTVRFPIKL